MKCLKSGDKVKVIAGDNKGKEGKIVKVDRVKGLAMIEGLGIRTRHMKKTQFNPAGGKKDIHTGIAMSNLKLVEAAKVVAKAKSAKSSKNASAAKSKKEAK